MRHSPAPAEAPLPGPRLRCHLPWLGCSRFPAGPGPLGAAHLCTCPPGWRPRSRCSLRPRAREGPGTCSRGRPAGSPPLLHRRLTAPGAHDACTPRRSHPAPRPRGSSLPLVSSGTDGGPWPSRICAACPWWMGTPTPTPPSGALSKLPHGALGLSPNTTAASRARGPRDSRGDGTARGPASRPLRGQEGTWALHWASELTSRGSLCTVGPPASRQQDDESETRRPRGAAEVLPTSVERGSSRARGPQSGFRKDGVGLQGARPAAPPAGLL